MSGQRRTSATRVATLFFLAAIAQSAVGSAAPAEAPFDAVVRIANRQNGGASLGSGTTISGDSRVSVVITCAHLFADGVGEVLLVASDAKPRRALIVAVDEENDLACLISADRVGPSVSVAAELPNIGAKLASCGFGPEGVFRVNRGEHLCYVTLRGGEFEGVLEMSGSARQGDSGGPIFNADGELVGVIMGTDGESVDGTHSRRIRTFLAAHPVTPALVAEAKRLASSPLDEPAAFYAATFDGQIEEQAVRSATATLSGRVLFDRSGVGGATVRLSGRAIRETRLDDDGRFVFDDLPTGRYRIDVEKIVKNRFREANRWVVVGPTQPSVVVELKLE